MKRCVVFLPEPPLTPLSTEGTHLDNSCPTKKENFTKQLIGSSSRSHSTIPTPIFLLPMSTNRPSPPPTTDSIPSHDSQTPRHPPQPLTQTQARQDRWKQKLNTRNTIQQRNPGSRRIGKTSTEIFNEIPFHGCQTLNKYPRISHCRAHTQTPSRPHFP